MMDPIKIMTQDSVRKRPHRFSVGDTVRVHVRIKEGERQRIQMFEGTVIARQHGGVSETFTVRRTSYGVGVERVFPMHSPNVEKVEIVRHGKVRRAKLYYLRDRVGKSAKVKQQILTRDQQDMEEEILELEANEEIIEQALEQQAEAADEIEKEVDAEIEANASEESTEVADDEPVVEEKAEQEPAPEEPAEEPATEEAADADKTEESAE